MLRGGGIIEKTKKYEPGVITFNQELINSNRSVCIGNIMSCDKEFSGRLGGLCIVIDWTGYNRGMRNCEKKCNKRDTSTNSGAGRCKKDSHAKASVASAAGACVTSAKNSESVLELNPAAGCPRRCHDTERIEYRPGRGKLR